MVNYGLHINFYSLKDNYKNKILSNYAIIRLKIVSLILKSYLFDGV